jgi:hypothetical protein
MNAVGSVLAALFCLVGALFLFTHWRTRQIEARFPAVGVILDAGGGLLHIVEQAPIGPERGVVLLVHGASGNHADMMVALGPRLAA